MLLLLFLGACVFLVLTPASLRFFGPPPGLGHLQDLLGFTNGTAFNAVSKGQEMFKDSSTVLDFALFKPHKPAVNNNINNGGDTAHSRLSASSSCPDPFRSPPLPPMSLEHATDLASDRCQPLDTVTGDFTISVCPALPGYSCNSFFVVVQRTDSQICSTDYAEAPLSAYKQDADDIRQSTGPDTFQVMITGSERYATSRHTGYDKDLAPCRYVYPVTLSNAGSFYLQVHQIWDEWHGDADKMARTRGSQEFFGAKDTVGDDGHHVPPVPRLIQRELLTGGIDGVSSTALPAVMQCSASCQKHAFTANSRSSPTGSVRILDDNTSRYSALPLCSMTDPIKGAYFPDPTPVQNASLPIVPYRWHPLGCRLSHSNVELLNGKLGRDRREQCLTPPRRIVFDGDSHTRMSYDALIPRLKDDGDALPIFVSTSSALHPQRCQLTESLTGQGENKRRQQLHDHLRLHLGQPPQPPNGSSRPTHRSGRGCAQRRVSPSAQPLCYAHLQKVHHRHHELPQQVVYRHPGAVYHAACEAALQR